MSAERAFPRASRREFLTYLAASFGALVGSSPRAARSRGTRNTPNLDANPFVLGVASGDPLPSGVILWTRLLPPEPLTDDVSLEWEMSISPAFDAIAAGGTALARAALAHSVHVDVRDLEPDRHYWYRFRLGPWMSPVGRTRTLPLPESSPEGLRLGIACCQSYIDGYYTAHAHLAAEDLDLVVFVGDYIYERGLDGPVRSHGGQFLATTLADYRERYAIYRSDPGLQAVHHRFPWLMTWDDHEVRNNYADLELDRVETLDEARAIRAAAYQAYYEHMPMRVEVPESFVDLPIYQTVVWGDLASLYVLDTRQYRDAQPCDDELGVQARDCPDLFDPRTMLGTEQKSWLRERTLGSPTIWNVIAQQTVFTPISLNGLFVNPDQWDGYALERRELAEHFRRVRNVVVLSGDIHAAAFNTIHATPEDPQSDLVGYEIVCTSLTSGLGDLAGLPFAIDDFLRQALANVHYAEADLRGYCVCEFDRDRMRVRYRVVDTVAEPVASIRTDAEFEVDADTGVFRQTLPAPTPTPTASPAPTPTATSGPTCWGDCDGDGRVTVDELVQGVAHALTGEGTCGASFDRDSDGVDVADIVTALTAALNGCG